MFVPETVLLENEWVLRYTYGRPAAAIARASFGVPVFDRLMGHQISPSSQNFQTVDIGATRCQAALPCTGRPSMELDLRPHSQVISVEKSYSPCALAAA